MKYLLFLCLLMTSIWCASQDSLPDSLERTIRQTPEDSNKVDLIIELGENKLNEDPQLAIRLYSDAVSLAQKITYTSGLARAHKALGIAYYFSGDYFTALEKWKIAQSYYEDSDDLAGVANMLSNSGAIFFNQQKFDRALEFYLDALRIAEEIGDTLRIGTILQNMGALYTSKGEYELALEYYMDALPMFRSMGDSEGMGLTMVNAGEIYQQQQDNHNKAIELYQEAVEHLRPTPYYTILLRAMGQTKMDMGEFDEGLDYLRSSYNEAAKMNDLFEMASSLNVLGQAHKIQGNIADAISYFKQAKQYALQVDDSNRELEVATMNLADLYSLQNNYRQAFENQKLLQSIKDTAYNIDSDRKFDAMLFDFNLEKKEVEIELLSKEQELQKAELKKHKVIRNGFIGGFGIVLLFAGVFFTQRNRIGREKNRSEELLLNILPEEVANELKEKGHSDAQLIEHVTVIFTDFKDFTGLSKKVTPKKLIADLHECFSAFDNTCEKYGIEKIKTIGDAYMAAGGLPTPNTSHPKDVVLAGIEMAKIVEEAKLRKLKAKQPYFEIRIGIHTGPVVAGIVGIKKFQYDIWGDTVNTASRMESHGAIGKVNISEITYGILKEDNEFSFTSRGKVPIKGKGEIDMYFVDHKSAAS